DAGRAVAVAREALGDPERLARIAKQGRELVEQRHSDVHRAADMLNVMRALLPDAPHLRRMLPENMRRNGVLLASAYVFLASELDRPSHAPHKDLFLRLARSLHAA
ncbi:MAG: glycosyltransferase, partial [Deltaproteobacteria bacterium]|nr:glycosyltransferase [Deltaproteobacteria bacterium]